ncbi:L-threonate dehydrogenase [Aestuariibius insulae]|uniref:L-threonate dehydrogenase n=1 Tax=Aestuariibius insulae TaxID=2058287 RepID=UPI00345E5B6F
MIVYFAGLGSMGSGMARCLIHAGHEVHLLDHNPERVASLHEAGGHPLQGNAPPADAIVSVVMNAEQTRSVLFADEALALRLKPGGVIVSCATVSPAFASEMEAEANNLGQLYVDAPISGGAVKAAEGTLSMMVSGKAEALKAATPLFDAMAETVHRMGDTAGAGSAMKAVNQLLAGIHVAAMGEALAFAASQKLDLEQVVKVVSASAGTSWMFENRAPHVVQSDYTPLSKLDIWLKDLGIVTDIARAADLPVPVAASALSQFRDASDAGFGQQDDAAVAKYAASRGGITLPGER